ncbi:MAG: hypothetical protein KF725_05220 [Cyclobacteriaceae bacterium]|nr:hypothetical protein [Cyclobacteriaceae bacterium]UYN85875.1 MAG: hypothetical protein KIT51_13500 [Cyclobacteriaceae bacterium]
MKNTSLRVPVLTTRFLGSSLSIAFIFLIAACTNMENAELSERTTFIKLYSGIQGIEATAAELTDDGYIVLGNMTIARDSVLTVVFKTDKRGNRTTPIRYYQGGSGNAIKALPNNQGYIIVGERIKTDPGATQTDNIDIISARMLHISNDLDSIKTLYRRDETTNIIKTDYSGVSVTITPNNKVVVLGTYQESLSAPVRPYLQYFNSTLTIEEGYLEYAALQRSYRNAKSLHYLNGNFVWATSIALEQQNFDFSYASIPFIQDGSVFTQNSSLGITTATTQSLRPNDIQPSKLPNIGDVGFGVVGTRANPNGSNANMIFFRVTPQGEISSSSVKYFDAIDGSVEATTSDIQDYGTALTATSDGGFVLAGHFTTNPQKGNGLNDILLVKVDLQGNMFWIKTIGGTGSETVSTIRETEDGGLLICGTNTLSNVPSIFLIKTDRNGELKN